jgi:hypothetical protein
MGSLNQRGADLAGNGFGVDSSSAAPGGGREADVEGSIEERSRARRGADAASRGGSSGGRRAPEGGSRRPGGAGLARRRGAAAARAGGGGGADGGCGRPAPTVRRSCIDGRSTEVRRHCGLSHRPRGACMRTAVKNERGQDMISIQRGGGALAALAAAGASYGG